MHALRIEVLRGHLVESVHRISAAVTDPAARLVARSGDAELVTYWRSAAKPFQALPLVADGAADRFGLDRRELALTCASHSSEPVHLEVTDGFLRKIGCTEADLACGPHPPLGQAVARRVARDGTPLSPRWSNCSGKHSGMLALARHHGWATAGYERAGHPVQERILPVVAEWAGLPASAIHQGVDGCTVVCFALPLQRMAQAYARFATSDEAAATRLRGAMMGEPYLVAGEGRFCTDLMQALPGEAIAKIGAEGVYSAALRSSGLGIALKVEDGDMKASAMALHGIVRQLLERFGGPAFPGERLAAWGTQPVRNTRGEATGETRLVGALEFV